MKTRRAAVCNVAFVCGGEEVLPASTPVFVDPRVWEARDDDGSVMLVADLEPAGMLGDWVDAEPGSVYVGDDREPAYATALKSIE